MPRGSAVTSARQRGPALFSAGPFSDSNYLLATGTGPQMTPGSTLIVRFRMNSALAADGYLLGRVDATRGWFVGLTFSNGHVSFFARGVPTFPSPIILDAGGMAGIEHAFAITDDAVAGGAGNYRYAANNGPATTLAHGAGAYVPATAATDFRIGRIYLSSAAAVKADVFSAVIHPSSFTNAQLTQASGISRRSPRYDPALFAGALFDLDISRDYVPGASTITSKGSAPVTLTIQGTVPRTARSRWAGADLSRAGASAFSDTTAPVLQTGADGAIYSRRSELARLSFTTDATLVSIEIAGALFTYLIASAFIEVQVNGAHQTTVPIVVTDVKQAFDITLPAGAKTVTLIESQHANPGTPTISVLCTSVTGISVPPGNTFAIVSPAAVQKRLVCYGDSITGGSLATSPQVGGWLSLVRTDYPTSGTGGVTAEAWGSRSLFEDYTAGSNSIATLVAKIVAECDGTSTNTLWIAIGTNDYGLNLWTAAAFQTQYTALLVALRAALPSLVIFCASPISRVAPSAETANGVGSTLGNYRTAISNAVTAAAVGATFVDASAYVSSPNHNADGVHPNDAGHAAYKAALKIAVGY